MLLLINAILILLVSTVGGQVGLCNFPKIKHGIVYDENRNKLAFPVAVGTIIYYSCEYNFVSPSKSFWTPINCTEEGWSPIPKCLRLCFFPSVENGQSASSGQTYVEGDSVIIYCNTGYSLSNSGNTISCMEDGWSSPPTCIHDTCPVPLLEENIDAHPKQESYKVGEVLKFLCRRRLIRVGPDSVQCYIFGWSPTIPTCKEQVKACGAPPPLLNGKLKETGKESYGHNSVVEYDCDHNFQLKGPRKIQCMDGEWTTLPICIEQVNTCGYIPKLENGYVQTSVPLYRHGDSIELSCKKTYTMIGKNVTTCIDGQWTQLPQCIATDQLKKCKKPTFSIIRPFYLFNGYDHNSVIKYRCVGSSRYSQATCINGEWDPEPDCAKNVHFCPPPPQIPNAQNMTTTVNFQDGERVAVVCKENYQLQDIKEIVCKKGQWQTLPRCVESKGQCGPPPSITNGDIASFPLPRYPEGSTVTYLCQSLYELQGSSDVTCHNGQWSEPPRCIDACVISEENMDKNNIELRWSKTKKLYSKTGDFIEFKCREGHKMKTPQQSFRTICREGKIEYPRCE